MTNALLSTDTSDHRLLRWSSFFWIVLFLITGFKVVVAWRLDPCYDEGYYFFWSLFPQWSYYDHPPLTAWAMTVSGAVFGDGIWTVRMWPIVASTLLAFIGLQLGRRIFSPAAGDLAGILLLSMPGLAGNGVFMTPDVFFSLGWAAAVFCAWRALSGGSAFLYWTLAGLSAGAGLLAKYNMVLFFLALAVLWAVSPGRRSPIFFGSLVCGVVALLVFMPVVWWNWNHDWASFRFQMKHGFTGKWPAWVTVPEYAGSLLLVSTPVVGLMAFYSSWRGAVSGRFDRRFLAVFFWTVVLFFAVSAFRRSVGPNWAMLGFFSALVLLAGDWPMFPRWLRGLALAFLAVFVLVGASGLLYLGLPQDVVLRIGGGPLKIPRMGELIGGKSFADAVVRKKSETGAGFVCVARHQMFGRLAFFAPSLRQELWLPLGGDRRFPWIDEGRWQGKDALVVVKSEQEGESMRRFFEAVEPAGGLSLAPKEPCRQEMLFYVGRKYRNDKGVLDER
jgi:4-amino-4-deoxy-L-arabinose transferase-like glycosyltransferase